MTEQQTEEPQAAKVAAEMGSRLEQLHAAYGEAKARADEATKQLKAITDGIKLELTSAAPDAPKIDLAASPTLPALRLQWVESWRLDSKRLKVDDPETWVRYAVKGGSWVLKVLGGGES